VGFEILTAVIVTSHRKECGWKAPEDEALWICAEQLDTKMWVEFNWPRYGVCELRQYLFFFASGNLKLIVIMKLQYGQHIWEFPSVFDAE
jgi:hypothetical protein